jgi:cytochrome c
VKVRKAAALLAEQGAAGLAALRDSTSEFTWKDTYVFVVDCDADEVLANPAFPVRQGGDIKQHTDYNGMRYGLALCETAKRPRGGWVEYAWPRPGGGEPSRKISYVVSVDGLPYQLGAGIYDETITIEELERLTDGHP